ncbi:MAG: aa3-type cytochrome c oxidase subunit IV [Alphaproteobacteria bacterium]
MASHTPAEDDPKQLENAQKFWGSFARGAKWGVVASAAVLIALLALFVPFGA